ncbi:uncharacterized protein LOC144108505 [Amblyomma americanum]
MGHIGYIEPFDETTSDWRSYEERLKAYLSVNDVPVAKKVPAFLSLIGAKTYALLKSLTAPSSREFDSLLKLLSDHLAPQSSVIAERAKFYKRSQRSVVPPKHRAFLLKELHQGHPGIVRCKELARSYVWWPGIDADLEQHVKKCAECQQQRNEPAPAPLHPWSWPTSPWQRVHLDFAGPMKDKMFLVAVDAHSKWPEVYVMQKTTAYHTIQCLQDLFSRLGVPDTIVTDNGPQFVSEEFKSFVRGFGGRHIVDDCARDDTVKPSVGGRVAQQQLSDVLRRKARERLFNINDEVLVRNYRGPEKWVPGTIIQRSGPVSFKVRVRTNHGVLIWRRHQDQLLLSIDSSKQSIMEDVIPDFRDPESDTEPLPGAAPAATNDPPWERRYPQRDRRPPDRYQP